MKIFSDLNAKWPMLLQQPYSEENKSFIKVLQALCQSKERPKAIFVQQQAFITFKFVSQLLCLRWFLCCSVFSVANCSKKWYYFAF